MPSSYGYDSYRGRGGIRTFLKAVIALLIVVLILVVAAFIFLQKYMVYSDDGQARLELPWLQNVPVETAEPSAPVTSQSVEVVTQEPDDQPTFLPLTVEPTVKGAMLAESYLNGQTLPATATDGLTAAIFDMKGDDGLLRYASQLSVANSLRVNTQPESRNEAIKAVTAGEVPTVARVSCLRDNHVPRQDHSMSLRTASGNWMDADGNRWVNPSSEKTRAYLAGVCAELAELGFDEILLDNAGYPTGGRTASIKAGSTYDPDHLDGAVGELYAQVQTALAAYPDVKLSIVVTPEALAGNQSGQTAELLGQYAQRVYVRTDDPAALAQAQAALVAAGLSESQVVCYHTGTVDGGTLAAPGGEATYTN